jgi:two-component system, NtrC family, nitrogen regulation response regulator GlnG
MISFLRTPLHPGGAGGEDAVVMTSSWEEFATHAIKRVHVREGVSELRIVEGANVGKSFELFERPKVLGSREPADFVLEDEHVSRLHCRLERDSDGGVRVVDLGSRNGTWLGGNRIVEAIVAPRARLTVGETTLELAVAERERVRSAWDGGDRFGAMIGRSPATHRLFAQLAKLLATDRHVLVRGESGTGKELVARALHELGPRGKGPFVVLDGACLSENLADVELFGHVRGAFTDAVADRAGAFERADGGTLLLDEIGELPPNVQAKLLRAIDTGMVQRVGDQSWRKVDVRVIAATHRPLERMVNEGSFRLDLFHRVSTFQVDVPALRDRGDDVRFIARRMLEEVAPGDDKARAALDHALDELAGYPWPGNIRELRNVVRRVAAFGDAGMQATEGFPEMPRVRADESFHDAKEHWVALFERQYLSRLLDECGGNLSEAARRSGLSRMHMIRLSQKHKLRASE